jgi:uncharacterized protein
MPDTAVHYMLIYEYVADMVDRRGPHREEHLARIYAERDSGRLVMAGALGDPPSGGALVFRGVEPEAIEAFVQDDPYMRAGLVASHRIARWNLV